MTLDKPYTIASDPYRSAKWDELTEGRNFLASDVPALTLLVQWYQIVDKCIEDMSTNGSIQVAFMNDVGDLKALPQITTMKQASAEIRALNKQLGINDGRDSGVEGGDDDDGGVLKLIVGRGPAARRAV